LNPQLIAAIRHLRLGMALDGKGFTLICGLKDGSNEKSCEALEVTEHGTCKAIQESTTVED
jgi:hypothetical protein